MRRWAFTMPGELGNKVNETELMPNHALQRTRYHAVVATPLLAGRAAELGALESNVRNKTA